MTLTLTQLIVYFVIAIISAYLAFAVIGTQYQSGILGAFIVALVGEWLMIDVLHLRLAPQVSYGGVQIITAIVGALALAFIWAVMAGSGYLSRWEQSLEKVRHQALTRGGSRSGHGSRPR